MLKEAAVVILISDKADFREKYSEAQRSLPKGPSQHDITTVNT